MNQIIIDEFTFRIPGIPSRYRPNYSKDFGCFVTGEINGMNCSEAEKAGLTRGSFVEMAICTINQRVLTFKPHYESERFTEIWGIPVGGEMKTYFNEKHSELSTFLINRQSQDKMKGLIEMIAESSEAYFSNIFRFEMVQSKGKYGLYYYLSTTTRPIATSLEETAIKAAREIFDANHRLNAGWCTDQQLVENEQVSMFGLAKA